jgi:hypothetical protein
MKLARRTVRNKSRSMLLDHLLVWFYLIQNHLTGKLIIHCTQLMLCKL